MARPEKLSNPLALAVLVLLEERPMHPYEIAATLKHRHKEKSIKLRYGSLYTVIEGLVREGLILARETVREGRRPERTIYELTPSGRKRMRGWLGDLLRKPVKEYPQFEAALSLMLALPIAEATALLEERLKRLAGLEEETRISLELVRGQGVEPLYLVEADYGLALLEAEQKFIAGLIARIREDADYVRIWKKIHAKPEGGKSVE
jgi:DNA-binding PadR family transcriptional regulator